MQRYLSLKNPYTEVVLEVFLDCSRIKPSHRDAGVITKHILSTACILVGDREAFR